MLNMHCNETLPAAKLLKHSAAPGVPLQLQHVQHQAAKHSTDKTITWPAGPNQISSVLRMPLEENTSTARSETAAVGTPVHSEVKQNAGHLRQSHAKQAARHSSVCCQQTPQHTAS